MKEIDSQLISRIFQHSSTALIITGNYTGEPIMSVTENIAQLLGYSMEKLDNHAALFDDLIHEDDIANYLLESQQATLEDDCQDMLLSEYRLAHNDGYYIWVKDHIQIVRSNNKVKQLVHVLTDITNEMSVRTTLMQQKEQLQSVLHKAGFGMWEWHSNTEILECDSNWSHLLGFVQPIKSMKISRLFALVHPDDLEAFKSVIESLRDGKAGKSTIIVRIRHLTGKWRYHECHAIMSVKDTGAGGAITYASSASKQSGPPTILMSHNDISAQKENELAAIGALDLRNQFFARVSHEIRTPLHGILGMLSLVKQDLTTDQAKLKVEKITAHSEQLLYLLNDILDLAKLNEAKLKVSVELVSVTEIINQVQRLFGFKAAEKSIALKTTLPALQHDMVVTDKVRLTQVLSNLVSNAIKYTHKGEVNIYTKLEHERLVICIQDSGIGIKDTASVFDAYVQEEGGYNQGSNSTGLGLEIVKKLCDLLGIKIELNSTSSGTLFRLVLSKPMPNTLVAMPSGNSNKTSVLNLEDISVLVVDDSDINREIVTEMLQNVGATCTHAVDGYEALKLIANKHYDVVLMDKHMPNMNGIDATREIRQNKSIQKQPVIIALTADAFDIDNDAWFTEGIDELVTKPFDVDILIKTISRCLRS
jgi:PAS domain S-box-containing protein